MELNGGHYFGGAQELYRELYEPFNLLPFPCGNSGCQMGGWFKKPIDTIEDVKGLKMRIPGFGGEVLRRNGGIPVAMPGGEIFTALQTGTIDAAEWIGPYNDLAFGMHKVANHYYYPGWHEPAAILDCFINLEKWNSLPDDLKTIEQEFLNSSAATYYEAEGDVEKSFFWDIAGNDRGGKCRPDWISKDRKTIVDLKTTMFYKHLLLLLSLF